MNSLICRTQNHGCPSPWNPEAHGEGWSAGGAASVAATLHGGRYLPLRLPPCGAVGGEERCRPEDGTYPWTAVRTTEANTRRRERQCGAWRLGAEWHVAGSSQLRRKRTAATCGTMLVAGGGGAQVLRSCDSTSCGVHGL